MKKLILFRLDGDNKIGMGHVFRSISLSSELKKHGFSICFLISKKNNSYNILKKYGKCRISPSNYTDELTLIKKLKPEIIIVDILKSFFPYGLTYFRLLQKLPSLLVTIDYVGKEIMYADLSFHTLFHPKSFSTKNTFHDLKYSIVRNEFVLNRKKFRFRKKISSIIILQGGSDTNCNSPKILKALENLPNSIDLTLVVGPSFKCWKQLDSIIKSSKRPITILENISNLANEIVKHDLAVTAAGNTLIELLTIGIPSVIIYGDEHEKEIAKILEKKFLCKNLGSGTLLNYKQIFSGVNKIINDANLRKDYSKNSRKSFDGKGTIRVTKTILNYYNSKTL